MDLSALLDQGFAALAVYGRLPEATECFRQAVEMAPDHPSALLGRAITMRGNSAPTDAEKLLRRILERDPTNTDAWAQLGTTLRLLNRFPESGVALERALKLTPGHAYAQQNLDYLGQLWRRGDCVQIDFLPRPRVRHGHGLPPHTRLAELLTRNSEDYRTAANELAAISQDLATIPETADPDHPERPWWDSIWLPPLDAAMLCAMIAHNRPPRLIEIGSGMSTRFARWSIDCFSSGTHLHSIDPEPRSEIDFLCDQVTRSGLEDTRLDIFTSLQADDILFYDGSHRSFPNSDVTVFFTEILPELASGVIVHIHDIFLPYDYPPNWLGRLYNEQYLLSSMLLAGQTRYQVLWPGAFIADLPALNDQLSPRLRSTRGGSFWMRVR